MIEHVILVNHKDEETGIMEKMQAHKEGLLHRAFSVFVFNTRGEMLLQRRALHKYHSAGLWTNTCCSHPKPGETSTEGANRRLKEEMGMDCALNHIHEFTYKVSFDNGLIEHEYDHVFKGITDTEPKINLEEVKEYKYLSVIKLQEDILANPDSYTEWFKIVMKEFAF